jgi:hypothetical protein
MILKDVNGELIFPMHIAGVEVYEHCLTPRMYARPFPKWDGFALVAETDRWDGESSAYYQERRVIAWFDSKDRAEQAKEFLLDGYTLTIPSVVKQ